MELLTYGTMNVREIPLTQGKVAIVDAEDCEWLNQWKWYAHREDRGKGDLYISYAVRTTKKADGRRTTVSMHREILRLNPGESGVDHIDHDGLNNTKVNLRLCTQSQNNANGRKRKGASRYKGVNWRKRGRKWRSEIRLNYKSYYLGLFVDEIEAACAYDAKAKELFGEYAKLNFPGRRDGDA